MVRWLVVSLVIDVLVSLVLTATAVTAHNNSQKISRTAHISCIQSIRNSEVINNLINTLAQNANASEVFGPAEKARRIAGLKALLIDVPEC